MKLHFKKVDSGFYRVETEKEHNGRKVFPLLATISKNNYGRKLWQIDIENHGRLVAGGHDCFSLAVAKQLIKENLTADKE